MNLSRETRAAAKSFSLLTRLKLILMDFGTRVWLARGRLEGELAKTEQFFSGEICMQTSRLKNGKRSSGMWIHEKFFGRRDDDE